MSLEELVLTDRIEVVANGSLQIRHRHSIVDAGTGVEKAASFHRHVLTPGQTLPDDACERTRAVAAAVWTPECVAAYQASLPAEPVATDDASVATADETPTEA